MGCWGQWCGVAVWVVRVAQEWEEAVMGGRNDDRGKVGRGCRRREGRGRSKKGREWEEMGEEGKGEGRKGWREVSINIMIYYRLATDAVTVEGILTSLEVRYFRTRVSLFTIRSSWL